MSAVVAKKDKNLSLTEGKISNQLLTFFFPLLFGSFFQQLYNTVDAVIVGRTLGKVALSAVGGSTGIIVAVFLNFFIGVSNGAAVIVSQYYGARRMDEVKKAVHTAVLFSILAGFGVTIAGSLLTPFMLGMMGTPSDVFISSKIYMSIFFLGMIPNFVYNMGASILRATGDTKRPLLFLIISCGANIVLDILFVIVFGMGIAGAALATVLCQVISAGMVLGTLSRMDDTCRLRLSELRIHGDTLKKIIRIGIPNGMQSLMYTSSNVLVQTSINSFGTNTVAAWTAYEKVDLIFWMILNSFGTSIMTFVGQNYGAGKNDRVRRGVNACIGMTALSTVVLSLLIYVFGGTALTIFTSDADVIAIGTDMIKFLTPTYVTYLFVEIYAGALRGMGDSVVPMIITGIGVCVLRVFWVLGILPFVHSTYVLMACYPASWVLCSIAFCIYYHYAVRKRNIVLEKV
ncbi:putative efflux protein, MATE family [Lachnospiraceae bacterium]|nr:putative efflux protein, MATE family [Lachnospiraceae bacterium]